MDSILSKLTSRKFWVALAAALASIGTSVGGLATGNAEVAKLGVVCLVVSQAIYSFCEAYVDGQSIKAQAKTTTTTINASTTTAIEAIAKKEAANG